MEKKRVSLTLPEDLYRRIQAKAEGQGKTLEDMILDLLQGKYPPAETGMSQDEEDKVKERLKALGYMD